MADVIVSQQAKRKRGRPRKDNRDGGLQPPENLTLMKTQPLDKNNSNNGSADMVVGSVVYGVIEGSFDAGYLISVTIGNEPTPFRGVVFQPKKIIPISAANDVAPQAKMYERRATLTLTPTPISDGVITPPERASKQAVVRPPSMHQSSNHEPMMMRTSSPFSNMESPSKSTAVGDPSGSGRSLRMVEEDEVMQAFEVSTSSGGLPQTSGSNLQLNHNLNEVITEHTRPFGQTIELLHQTPAKTEEEQHPMYYTGTDVSFHPSLFNEAKSLSEAQFHTRDFVSTSQDLKLGLDKPEPQPKTGYGFHQALVAGNPLLLPPDLGMEKPNLEQESRGDERLVGDNAALPTRPTTQTNYCMGDMDFVLNDTVRNAETHLNQTESFETTHTPHSTT